MNPKPPCQRRIVPRRPPKRRVEPMTVCIAAACEEGKQVVCATDGLLSMGTITADVMATGKFYFINEWLFMYAGRPSQSRLILDEMYNVQKDSGLQLNRENVIGLTREAYNRRMGRTCSAPILGPLGIDLEDFKKNGFASLGKDTFERLALEIQAQGQSFNEQLLVIGWGPMPAACMIYEIGPEGDSDHALEGMAAIGSGSEVALSTMLLLGQSRHCYLPETLYAVASAKFAAEKSRGQDVGPHTSLYIIEKHREGEPCPPGRFVQPTEVDRLRDIWERHGRPKIDDDVHGELCKITKSIGYDAHISADRIVSTLRSASQKSGGQR